MTAPLLKEIDRVNEGVTPDLHEFKKFLWSDSRNVMFVEEGVRKMPGWSAAATPLGSAPVRGMGQLLDGASQKLFFGDQAAIYLWNAVSVSDVSKVGGYTGNLNETVTTFASTWSMAEWGTWMIATNGVDAPQIWKAAGLFADLGGTPPATAEIMMTLGPYMIAFNTPLDPAGVEWCDTDDVEDWVPISTNQAGNFIIRDFDSRIVGAAYLGDRIAVYGEDRMAIVQQVGLPNIIGHRPLLKGIGAVSKKSVVAVGKLNYGFGRKGIFVTDGTTFKYLDRGKIRRALLAEVNFAQRSKINGYHDAENTQIIWYYPTTTGEPTKGVSYNYTTESFSFLDHGRTSSEEQRIFDNPIVAAADGKFYFTNFGVDADGAAMTAWVESHPYPVYDERRGSLDNFYKWIESVKLAMETFTGTGLKFKYAIKEKRNDTAVFVDSQIVLDPSDFIWLLQSGVWWVLRIESDAVGDNWDLQSISIFGKLAGRVR